MGLYDIKRNYFPNVILNASAIPTRGIFSIFTPIDRLKSWNLYTLFFFFNAIIYFFIFVYVHDFDQKDRFDILYKPQGYNFSDQAFCLVSAF